MDVHTPQVPLLATVVLLLDDEAETVGMQLIRLSHTVDPVVRTRLRLLRVKDARDQLIAAPLIEEERAVVPSVPGAMGGHAGSARLVSYEEESPQRRVSRSLARATLPDDTVLPASSDLPQISTGTYDAFEAVLRGAIQQALYHGGTEPLSQQGYTLVPNEFAVYLVGRSDTALLPLVARETKAITSTIAPNTDARRFAMLLAAPHSDDPRFATSNPQLSAHSAQLSEWQALTMRQPWRDLLSWQSGEPPLLYAFVYEPWDESSHYHWRNDLHYAMAESLFALFAAGLLESPALKDALDLSTASLETGSGLSRIGSIGTSLITTPTQGMLEYLALRLSTDVLLRRGLMGTDGGYITPDRQHAISSQAQHDAEHWVSSELRPRLEPDYYPLPLLLPKRQIEDGTKGEWFGLALSKADPDPSGLLWRWQRMRSHLDDERFWNLSVQNEYETIGDARAWEANLTTIAQSWLPDIQRDIVDQIRLRTLGPEGVERAKAFATELGAALVTEERRLDEDRARQSQQLDRHHHALEADLRRAHPRGGIPGRPNPPAREMQPQLPRSLEVQFHEVITAQFNRTPMPWTLAVVGVMLALVGALAIYPILALPFVISALPASLLHTLAGPYSHWIGAGVMLIPFALALIGSAWQMSRLVQWQRRYAAERTLLWLAYAKDTERQVMRSIIAGLQEDVEQASRHIESWLLDIDRAASELAQQAVTLAGEYGGKLPLSRDIFVAQGIIWEGIDPAELYLHVRQQLNEPHLIAQFLQYIQAHAGDVIRALNEHTIGSFALSFMRSQLQSGAGDHPFTQWEQATAQQALQRAIQAASIPLQPQLAGQPLGHFDALAVHPSVPWIARMAAEHGLTAVPAPSDQWCLVARFITRARHALLQ